MKERPILFSAAMVRAILEERKTQTRRPLKDQPLDVIPMLVLHEWCGLMSKEPARGAVFGCRYGVPGDRLWVKETHWRFGWWIKNGWTKKGKQAWKFAADGLHKHAAFTPPHHNPSRTEKGWHKRPSIFMPRWASRITLEITAVRVERLQDITHEDAACEGVQDVNTGDFITPYATLWDKINRKTHPWPINPWVWVITFKRINP